MNTCPEISFALSVLSRYLTKSTPQYGAHAKHLLRYVWGRKHAKITWCVSNNNAVVSWKTNLSVILTTSSIETEMISVAHCDTEVVFLRKLAEELGFNQVSPDVIYEDNNDCID